jgi:two-component system, OmpR family, phosphate regulon sensor histidine kinase PhoR
MLGVVCVLAIALTAVDILTSGIAERSYKNTLQQELAEKGRMMAALPPAVIGQRFQDLARAAGARLTLIDREGKVLRDSEARPETMENHRTRPEFAAALEGREGSNVRSSATLGIEFLYVAVPVNSGALRLAMPLSQIGDHVRAIRNQVLASTAIAFVPAAFIALLFSRYVSSRLGTIIAYAGKLAEGRFDARLEKAGHDELCVLSTKLNETAEKLERIVKQLESEHAELERLERVRRDFVINVSHELRTPLASIQGYAETLLDGAIHDPDNNIRFLRIIRQNAERLTGLTADLLTISRVELGTKKFQFAAYYVNPLLTDHVDTMRPIAAKKRIELELRPAPPITEAFCDADAMHQILTNLLDNAIKYTPETGKVVVGALPLGEDWVEIYVQDTGIGIPKDELPRLFERFYRVDKARSRELGGTGLGLAIVKHLVRAQGGDIRVESEINSGSRFSFTLPVHDIGQPETESVAETTSQSTIS